MVPPGSYHPPGGPRIIVKYQVTTFKLHRMPTLLIVRHGERCLRGWLAFATSPPGGKQRVWNGSRGSFFLCWIKICLREPFHSLAFGSSLGCWWMELFCNFARLH